MSDWNREYDMGVQDFMLHETPASTSRWPVSAARWQASIHLFNRVWCFSFLTCCLEWVAFTQKFHGCMISTAVWEKLAGVSFNQAVITCRGRELIFISEHNKPSMSAQWNLNRLLSQHSNSVESCSAKERVRGDRRQDRFQANLKWVIFRIFSFSTDNPTWVST